MNDDEEYQCVRCKRFCGVVEEVCIDHEDYGDQRVERRSYYVYSACCLADVEPLKVEGIIH